MAVLRSSAPRAHSGKVRTAPGGVARSDRSVEVTPRWCRSDSRAYACARRALPSLSRGGFLRAEAVAVAATPRHCLHSRGLARLAVCAGHTAGEVRVRVLSG